MERVAFLIEQTGQRLSALLNPESLVMRRRSGVQVRSSMSGQLTAARLMDDPLLYTGGGETELELDLLFDASLLDPEASPDIRELTRPLWQLAENGTASTTYGRPPLVRFLWGKVWNLPGIVQAVAERLEQFDASGTPQRSWLRMRLLRSGEPPPPVVPPSPDSGMLLLPEGADVSPDNVVVHEVIGAGPDSQGERLDIIAERYYGNATLWRAIAAFNDLDDPTSVPAGTLLRIPPLSVFARSA